MKGLDARPDGHEVDAFARRVGTEVVPAPAAAVSWKPAASIAGWLFVLMFIGLAETFDGFRIQSYPPFSWIAQGELMLWIGTALLLVPGSVLIGLGHSDSISPLLRRGALQVEGLGSRGRRMAVVIAFLVFTAIAWAGNTLVLGGFPVTDDEYAARFGGQVIASGHTMVPVPPFADSIPMRFLFVRDGFFTSMDWLGPQIVWAVSEWTHTGNLVWAVLAAMAFAAVAVTCGVRLGSRWAVVAGAFFALSPMGLALSFSSHAHLASRAFFAVALAFLAVALSTERARPAWFLFGLSIGISFLCRPFETAFLGLPIGLDLLWRTLRGEQRAIEGLGATVAGAAAPIAVFCAYSWIVTGNPLVPPRFVPGAAFPSELPVESTWSRFGNGVSFNALLLSVWFLGPMGVGLAVLGAWRDRFTRLLVFGIGSVLALNLLHDNFGIHTVGPIHYSECVVPLAILATEGIRVTAQRAREHCVAFGPIASVVVVVLVIAMGAFNVVNCAGLRRQADIQAGVYDRIESRVPEGSGKAIVLAPDFASIWKRDATFVETGSWVFDWKRPRPDFSDDVMILHDVPGVEARLRRAFPDRRLYRVLEGRTGADFEIVPASDTQSAGS